MVMTDYSIGIVAHHTRQTMAEQLAETTGAAIISVDPGTQGATTNHLHVWRQLAQSDSYWSIVLEDDAQPVNDFLPQLEPALNAAPAVIVSFYLGRKRPPQHQRHIAHALEKADANHAHWILADQLFHAVAVAIHTHWIPHMLTNTRTYLPIDENIGRWARHHLYSPIAYTVPSLCDHADGPTLIHHPDQHPRPPGRKAWRTGTHTTWNNTTVEL